MRCSRPSPWCRRGPRACCRPSMPLLPTIAFEDVRFSYPGGRGAAHDGLSFAVGAGEKIGIVGPSGSGKSSVARLLLRLFDPQHGRVLIGGRDLKSLDPEMVRRMIAVVHQDTYLFHGTVEENLRLGKPDAEQRRNRGRSARCQCPRIHLTAAARLPDHDRRARRHAVGRPAPAAGDRSRPVARRAHPDPRRGAVLGRRRKRSGDPAGDRPAAAGRTTSSWRTGCRA